MIAAIGPEQAAGAVGRQVREALAFVPATSLGAVVRERNA